MYCTKCGTLNSDTSKFCSECGTKLVSPKPVQPQLEPEQVEQPVVDDRKVGDLLFRAFRQYDTGEIEEALKSCEEALKLSPSSTSVHSLLSLIYENKGDLDMAVSEIERVLELNPNSTADQGRLDQLKRTLSVGPPRPTVLEAILEKLRNTPQGVLIVSAAAFLIVFALILFWPRMGPTPQRTVQTSAPVTVPGETMARAPGYPYSANQQPAASAYPYGPTPPPQPPATAPPPAVEPEAEVASPGHGAARAVGAASGPQPFPEVKIEPRKPEAGARPATAPAPQQKTPEIEIVATPRKQPPVIEGAAKRVESATLLEQARAAQLAGNYREAIQQYQQALRGAAGPASIHQQIAICQQRLGREDDAAASYRAAIDAYKKQIAESKNVEDARRGLAAAEAGLRLVQGGG